MSFDVAMILVAVGAVLSCLTAIASRSLHEFSRSRLEELCPQRKGSTNLVGDVIRRHGQVATAVECLNLLLIVAVVSGGICGPLLLSGDWRTWQWIAWGLFGTVALLAFQVWIPWTVARIGPERFLLHTWCLWRIVSSVMAPAVFGAWLLNEVWRRMAGLPERRLWGGPLEDEIRTIVAEGHREGLLQEGSRSMIEGVIELREATVSQIMTPRTYASCMPVSRTLEEAVHFVIQAGHSRIPVYDKTRDDIVGVLYAKDLMIELAKPNQEGRKSLTEILRRPYFVPESKPVHDLLQEFQKTRNHMAVVLDEYGGVSGLVTIEDVLEEIVGEIADEYDAELVDDIKRIDDHTSEVLARVHIDELNERLGISLSEESEFDTIGGFVFSELGRIPQVGEVVVWNNVRITVLEVSRRRIERLRIEVLDEAQKETA